MSGKKSSNKGSTFERTVCKELSLAYTDGKNDNVFWRTAGSGARATFRRKAGAECYNIGGDIGFLDPIGKPLLERYYFELKCGYKHWNVFDWCLGIGQKDFDNTMQKLLEEAGEKIAVLILKQDRKTPLVLIPYDRFPFQYQEASDFMVIERWHYPSLVNVTTLENFYKYIRMEVLNEQNNVLRYV